MNKIDPTTLDVPELYQLHEKLEGNVKHLLAILTDRKLAGQEDTGDEQFDFCEIAVECEKVWRLLVQRANS